MQVTVALLVGKLLGDSARLPVPVAIDVEEPVSLVVWDALGLAVCDSVPEPACDRVWLGVRVNEGDCDGDAV